MNNYSDFLEKVQKSKKSERITPRVLLSHFGYTRRGVWVCQNINQELRKRSLETVPYWAYVWLDQEIELKHIDIPAGSSKAKTQVTDPIKQINILVDKSAREPEFVKPEDPITKATTLMLQKGYSHLLVSSNNLQQNSILGYISWRNIALRQLHGQGGKLVKDYLEKKVCILPSDTPFLDAIEKVHEYEFILVSDETKKICRIITTTEMSSTYKSMTEQFLLIEQIEQQVRILLHNKISLDNINASLSKTQEERVHSLDDLTFGDYVKILEYPDNWEKLSINLDKQILTSLLDEVRKIRNNVMHFAPSGIAQEQLEDLSNISKFLDQIINLSKVTEL